MQRLIIECAVRAALIAMGTAAALRLLRVKSAGARHAAWAGVVALMLLLPAWMAWGPRVSLHVLPKNPAPIAMAPIVLSTPIPFTAVAVPSVPVVRPGHWNWLAILYLSGVFILLMRLALGTVRAHALMRRAALLNGQFTSALCSTPVTVGWLRPAVILPENWRRWPQAQLDAVLTHEGEHRRRRDPLVQWLALLNRAIFWFHPLAWWLERRLSALAEEACDAAVLQRGHDPRDYSGYLLELARSVSQSGARVNLVGMAMAGSSLPQRIRQMLGDGPAPRVTRVRALSLAVACALLSTVFAAANVDRQQSVPPPAPPAPPAPFAAPVPPAPPAPIDVFPATPPQPPDPAPAYDFAPPPPPPPAAAPAYDFAPPPPPPPAAHPAAAPVPASPAFPPQPPAPPDQKYAEKRLIVLYFDLDGLSAELQARATSASAEFVRTRMQPNDLVAIMTASPRLKVVEDFTGDRDRLTAALEGTSFDTNSGAGGLAGLLSATEMLRHIHVLEKKAIVYFTTPAFRHSVGPEQLRTVIEMAESANVAFYPIDITALTAAGGK